MRWPRPAGGGASHGRPDAPRRRQGKEERPGRRPTRWPPPGGWRRPAWWRWPRPAATPSGATDEVAAGPWDGRRSHEWGGAAARPPARGVSQPPRARRHATAHAHTALSAHGAGARAPPVHPSRRYPGASTDTRWRKEEGERGCRGGGGRATAPRGASAAAAASTGRGAAPRGRVSAVRGRGGDAHGTAVAWAGGSPAGGRASAGG